MWDPFCCMWKAVTAFWSLGNLQGCRWSRHLIWDHDIYFSSLPKAGIFDFGFCIDDLWNSQTVTFRLVFPFIQLPVSRSNVIRRVLKTVWAAQLEHHFTKYCFCIYDFWIDLQMFTSMLEAGLAQQWSNFIFFLEIAMRLYLLQSFKVFYFRRKTLEVRVQHKAKHSEGV